MLFSAVYDILKKRNDTTKETLRMPIWMLIPFATAGLMVPFVFSYFRSTKKDKAMLVIFITAFVLNIAGGILQLIAK